MAAGELVIEGVAKSFGDLVVLRGVDLAVQPGRILGFLGRNGAGGHLAGPPRVDRDPVSAGGGTRD